VILWPLLALVVVVTLAVSVWRVPPALAHRRHQATLANIARLERELGQGEAWLTEALSDDGIAELSRQILQAQEERVYEALGEIPPSERIFADCAVCGRNVAINAGRCQPSPPACAKRIYWEHRP